HAGRILPPIQPRIRSRMHPSHYIASGRARLAATVMGSGPPVVFLHAGVADSRMWRDQLGAISGAGHQAIAYDRRGVGQTQSLGRRSPLEYRQALGLVTP